MVYHNKISTYVDALIRENDKKKHYKTNMKIQTKNNNNKNNQQQHIRRILIKYWVLYVRVDHRLDKTNYFALAMIQLDSRRAAQYMEILLVGRNSCAKLDHFAKKRKIFLPNYSEFHLIQ